MARNAHHDRVMDDYYAAREAWFLKCEEVTLGYATEIAEFKLDNPHPQLADFLKLHSHQEY